MTQQSEKIEGKRREHDTVWSLSRQSERGFNNNINNHNNNNNNNNIENNNINSNNYTKEGMWVTMRG